MVIRLMPSLIFVWHFWFIHSVTYQLSQFIFCSFPYVFISFQFKLIESTVSYIHLQKEKKAFYIDYENVNIHFKLSKPLQATNQTWIYAIIYSVDAPVQCYRSRFKLVFLNVKLVLLNVVISFSKTRQSLASFCCQAVRLQSRKHLNKVFLKTRIQYMYLPWRKTW